jgi:hypothetical protein
VKVEEKAKYSPRPKLKYKGIMLSRSGAIRITECEKISRSI